MVAVQFWGHTHIRIITISRTIFTIICITMVGSMAMAIIDMAEIDIMVGGTTIEGITVDIMAVAAGIMVADMGMEEERHTEEDMREVPIEAVDTMAEVVQDIEELVAEAMPGAVAEVIVEAVEAIGVAAVAVAVVEEEAVAAAGVADAPGAPLLYEEGEFFFAAKIAADIILPVPNCLSDSYA